MAKHSGDNLSPKPLILCPNADAYGTLREQEEL